MATKQSNNGFGKPPKPLVPRGQARPGKGERAVGYSHMKGSTPRPGGAEKAPSVSAGKSGPARPGGAEHIRG
jgi:hypothetical protein